ncbi:MAG: hypothetical protein IPM81_15325 [Saprospirales bacterium]|nr:hypothetical protein [Saprospirales bacterium]
MLAQFSKTSPEALEQSFLQYFNALQNNPDSQAADLLLGFVYDELFAPIARLYVIVETEKISFASRLATLIKSSLTEPLRSFIALSNASARYLCTRKQSFSAFTAYPWQLDLADTLALDACMPAAGSTAAAFESFGSQMLALFYPALGSLKEIVAATPGYVEESLVPLEKALQQKHEPHLGLLFAFLQLFRHFQGDLNQLSQKHLDFFFREAVRLAPMSADPDKIHLVFEVAKHLNHYKVKKDTSLKDGKDGLTQDIEFTLDQEIILDKAAVSDLRTLFLHPSGSPEKPYVEGVYITTAANSADGKGKPFGEDGSKNWSTLGAKFSKCILPGKNEAEVHPYARIGFVLASPVLFLQEGKRKITLTLTCSSAEDAPLVSDASCFTVLQSALSKPFYQLDDSSITKLEALFSEKALQYLETFLVHPPFLIGEEQNFISFVDAKEVTEDGEIPIFTDDERRS